MTASSLALLLLLAAPAARATPPPARDTAAARDASGHSSGHSNNDGLYLVGIGKADITGPIVDVNLMGYSMPDQTARGLHTRLYARTFIFAEAARPE